MAEQNFFHDYNVLSPKGPDVNENLIVDAKLKGAQTGQLTPSVTQSVIEGGIKGVGQGIEIYKGVQEIQRNQQIMDRAPIEQQQAQAELERTKAQTAELQSRATGQDPADQRNQLALQQAQAAVAEENTIFSEYKSLDPKGQAQMLLSGKYDRYFGQEPGTFQQMIETTNQRGGFQGQESAYDSLAKSAQKKGIQAQWEKDLEKNDSELKQMTPGWEANPVRSELAEKLQQNPDQAVTEVEFYANGTFPIVEEKIPGTNKSRLVKGAKGTKPEDLLMTPNKEAVDIFSKDGQFIATVSKDQAQQAQRYRDKLNAVTGLSRNRDMANVDKGKGSPVVEGNEAAKTAGAPGQPGPAAAKQEKPTLQNAFTYDENSPERELVFKQSLKVSDDVYEVSGLDAQKVMSDIETIGKTAAYQGTNLYKKAVEVEPLRQSAEDSVREIIKTQEYADSQNTRNGRLIYSEENLKEFQKAVKDNYYSEYLGGPAPRSFANPDEYMTLRNGTKITRTEAESVATVEDMYYAMNKQSIDDRTKAFVDEAVGEATKYYQSPIEGVAKGKENQNKRLSRVNSSVRWPQGKNPRSAPESQMQTPMDQPAQAEPEVKNNSRNLVSEAINGAAPGSMEGETQEQPAITIRPGLEQNRMSGYSDLITKYSAENGLPPNLVASLIWQESRGNPKAVGPYLPKYRTNAKGLTQFLPSTLKEMGYDDPFDPEQSIAAGAKYLKQLWERYGSVELALAAYNWGMGNVDNYREGKTRTVPPQTTKYVKSIMSDFNKRNQQRVS